MFPWSCVVYAGMWGSSQTTHQLQDSGGDADDVIRTALQVGAREAGKQFPKTNLRGVNHLTNSHRGSLSCRHRHYVQGDKTRIPM